MPRKIEIRLTGFDEAVVATILDEEEPEFAEQIWNDLSEPVKLYTWHTSSTGDWFSAKARPDAKRQSAGTQAKPLGKPRLLSDIPGGSIIYSGTRVFGFAYGPDISEPLPAKGPVVASADDIDAFYRAGRHVWNSYMTHEPVFVTATRRED
jgi:hypothetical protein